MKPEGNNSEADVLRIDEVAYPGGPGRIGLTLCPGRRVPRRLPGPWDRDLGQDLAAIRDWPAATVVTLIEDHEFHLLEVESLAEGVRERGMQWLHLPIVDCRAPDARFVSAWPAVGPRLHRQLVEGENILIHCRGGLGRSGTLAAQLLIEVGVDCSEAIRQVRAARRYAIDSGEQERYLHRLAGAEK